MREMAGAVMKPQCLSHRPLASHLYKDKCRHGKEQSAFLMTGGACAYQPICNSRQDHRYRICQYPEQKNIARASPVLRGMCTGLVAHRGSIDRCRCSQLL